MTEAEKSEIIEIILADIEKLNKKITELKDFIEPISPDNAIGRVSHMDAINNKSIFDASMRNSQERLNQLKEILKHTNNDDFGICIKCRQSIPFERLKIRPEIRLCANCLKK